MQYLTVVVIATQYLICCTVYGGELGLIVQHLLKVGHMPEPVSGVAMKPLQHKTDTLPSN